jgi:hypothetical protein
MFTTAARNKCVIKIIAVVRVLIQQESRNIRVPVLYITMELTQKRRGGIMGERLVYASFTTPAKKNHTSSY